jgi:hypothetical protein
VLALLTDPPANTRITILDPDGLAVIPGPAMKEFSMDAGMVADSVALQWIAEAGATRCLCMRSIDGEEYRVFHSRPRHSEPYLANIDCFAPKRKPQVHDLVSGAVLAVHVDMKARQKMVRQGRRRAAQASRWRRRRGRPLIYYAHSMRCYNTPKEVAELAAIRRSFPGATIVNPSGFQYDGHGMTMFLRAVDQADMTIFSPYEGHLGRGVFVEVSRALQGKKPVYIVDENGPLPWRGAFRIINQDWAVRYAVPEM